MARPLPPPRSARRAARTRRRLAAVALGTGAIVTLVLIVVLSGGGGSGRRVATGDRARRATTTLPSTTVTTVAATPSTTVPVTTAPATTAPATTVATQPPATVPPGVGAIVALSGRTIVVDPGHNGQNYRHPEINQPVFIGTMSRACDTTGTATNDGSTESSYNLDVALRLAGVLRSAGATVVMTRTDDNGWGPCIDERAAIGNRAAASVGISIHADGGPSTGRGFHVIFPADITGLTDGIYGNSKRLAHDVHDAFAAGTPMPIADYIGSGGYSERSDLGGLNLSKVPKVFIETGNMRNGTDAALLESPTYRQAAAQAIAAGLAAYLAGK